METTEAAELTRQQLYELVWSEPLSRLAGRYGLSDVGLAKICGRHRVPRPWRGYWAQKAAGKRIRLPTLPKLTPQEEEEGLGTISIAPRIPRSDDKPDGPVATQERYEREHPISVPERVGRYHPLVRQTREWHKSIRGSGYSPTLRRSARLAVSVADGSLTRALRIFDTLIKALEKREFAVSTSVSDGNQNTVVTVNGEDISIEIVEKQRQVQREDTLFGSTYTDLEYTGQLALKIDEPWAEGVRKTWADGKRQRVEQCLNAFIVGLLRAAEAKKEHRQKAEEWRREWRRKEEERKLAAWKAQEENRRIERLERAVASWVKANQVREFVEAVVAEKDLDHNPEIGAWVVWARSYAESLDPVCGDIAAVVRDPFPRTITWGDLPDSYRSPDDRRTSAGSRNLS